MDIIRGRDLVTQVLKAEKGERTQKDKTRCSNISKNNDVKNSLIIKYNVG